MGVDVARRSGARRLTFVNVKAAGGAEPYRPSRREAREEPAFAELARWLDTQPPPDSTTIDFRVESGVPSIEICRAAEERGADLLILGRKPRSQANRLMVGDTADAVARRSLVPSLHVPPRVEGVNSMLVALDGSERGLVVFRTAANLAAAIGATIRAVTVEAALADEPAELVAGLPTARSARLLDRLRGMLSAEQPTAVPLLEARRGDVVEQVLVAVAETAADLLVVGCHRGGPPGVVEAGSVARRLEHLAPCTLLTVPL